MILAGDVGGTKTVLAVYDFTDGQACLQREQTFGSRDHDTFQQVVDRFLEGESPPLDAACFGVAGPVLDGEVRTTNLPWVLSEAALGARLGARVTLLNDLEAAAVGLLNLPAEDFTVLQAGRDDARGNIAVVAPGTGLGMAVVVFDGDEPRVLPSEGGHASFPPRGETQVRLLESLAEKFGAHVSCERVLSGPGLQNVYHHLRDSGYREEPSWLRERMESEDPAAVIGELGLSGGHDLCVAALEIFCDVLGAVAGNLALISLSHGGVLVGGGIPPKILPAIQRGGCLAAFEDKGRYRDLMRRLPFKISMNPRAPLIGAAYSARP